MMQFAKQKVRMNSNANVFQVFQVDSAKSMLAKETSVKMTQLVLPIKLASLASAELVSTGQNASLTAVQRPLVSSRRNADRMVKNSPATVHQASLEIFAKQLLVISTCRVKTTGLAQLSTKIFSATVLKDSAAGIAPRDRAAKTPAFLTVCALETGTVLHANVMMVILEIVARSRLVITMAV